METPAGVVVGGDRRGAVVFTRIHPLSVKKVGEEVRGISMPVTCHVTGNGHVQYIDDESTWYPLIPTCISPNGKIFRSLHKMFHARRLSSTPIAISSTPIR